MKHSRVPPSETPSWTIFPELARPETTPAQADASKGGAEHTAASETRIVELDQGHVTATVMSFKSIHKHGDLLVRYLRARHDVFIDRLQWQLPETDGMEFDQYDTPYCRWIILHEFGEVLGGVRLTPTTAQCGNHTYMLRDAQKGELSNIPTDVLFFEAPVEPRIWEASRLFIAAAVPAQRRSYIQGVLMNKMSVVARDEGASHVIGIVPYVFSRWLRRLGLGAVPVGPKFEIDGTTSQAALFNVAKYVG